MASVVSGLPLWQLEEDPPLLEAVLDALEEQARREGAGPAGGVLTRLKARLGVVD